LRVAVPAVSLGPSRISVYGGDSLVYALDDDQFTVTSEPIVLHDFEETITRDDYQTGVGADGTVYLAFDLKAMTEATTYSGVPSDTRSASRDETSRSSTPRAFS